MKTLTQGGREIEHPEGEPNANNVKPVHAFGGRDVASKIREYTGLPVTNINFTNPVCDWRYCDSTGKGYRVLAAEKLEGSDADRYRIDIYRP